MVVKRQNSFLQRFVVFFLYFFPYLGNTIDKLKIKIMIWLLKALRRLGVADVDDKFSFHLSVVLSIMSHLHRNQ